MNQVSHRLSNANPAAQKPLGGVAEDQQIGDISRQPVGIASSSDLTRETDGSKPTQEFVDTTDVLALSDESWIKSYSFEEGIAPESPGIEPSPQSIEYDITRSLEDAEVPPEEIPSRVKNVMEMILQKDQQTPDPYPNISADGEVP